MRWCWQQDFRHRPSANQLEDILTNPSIPYLVDAMSLHNSNTITCSCVSTLPIEILPTTSDDSSEGGGGGGGGSINTTSFSASVSNMVQGDLQEELWLSTYNEKNQEDTKSEIVVINFKGKAVQVSANMSFQGRKMMTFLSFELVVPSV